MFKRNHIDERCLTCRSTVKKESQRKDNPLRPNDCSYTLRDGVKSSNCPYDTGRLRRLGDS